jgi:hypothetical protein
MTAADERSEIYLSVLRALTKVGEEIARRNAARERPTPAQKQRWQRELSDLITEVDAL